jgi:hypothetical protein
MTMRRRVVYVDDETWADLTARARSGGVTISRLLREAARAPIATRSRPDYPAITMSMPDPIAHRNPSPGTTIDAERGTQSVLFRPAPKPVPRAKARERR